MPSEWERTTVGELCDEGCVRIQTGPFGSQLHAEEYTHRGIPVIPTEALRNRQIDHAVLPKISKEKAIALARHRVEVGDILFARRGVQATGHIGFAREEERGFICGTGATLMRVLDKGRVHPDYLSHVFADNASIAWFKFHAIGATMPNLNESIIRSFSLILPPFAEQREIARILNAIDDRIALLSQTNTTLEETARGIFNSWFVNFDPVRAKAKGREPEDLDADTSIVFPSEFQESELGPIPKGWSISTIGQTVHVVDCLHSKKPDRTSRKAVLAAIEHS